MLCTLILAGAGQTPALPPPDILASLYSPPVIKGLFTVMGPCEYAAKDFYSPYPIVPRAQLPDNLVKECEMRMLPVLKKEYIPANLNSLWFGIRENFPLSDILVANFQVGNYDITWIDCDQDIKIHVRNISTNQYPNDQVGADALIKESGTAVFKVPSDWTTKFKFLLYPVKTDKDCLWQGNLENQTDSYNKFFNHCSYFTDGKTSFYEFGTGRGGAQGLAPTVANQRHPSRILDYPKDPPQNM